MTPQDDTLEHSCSDAQDMNGNSIPDSTVKGLCQDHNNYVWIEHPNGECDEYTHFQTGSVTMAPPFGNGWQVGDTIQVGQAIGFQSDIGSASGSHLHFEVAAIPASAPSPPFSQLGGFVSNSWNVVTVVCFSDGDTDGDSLYTQGESYTAGPCVNTAPTAEAGGPYQVNEGSVVQLDGSGSTDPHNAVLSYSWSPTEHLNDASIAMPTYTALDDTVDNITLTVSDLGGDVTAATEMTDDDETTVTVLNVLPRSQRWVTRSTKPVPLPFPPRSPIPGTLDTHTASILWGDGSPAEMVSVAALAAGVDHVYGDNGSYSVTVTVTDDDGGSGGDTVDVVVGNLAPEVEFDTSGAIAFPGGAYHVVKAGSRSLPYRRTARMPARTHPRSRGPRATRTFTSIASRADPMFLQPIRSFPSMRPTQIDAVYAAPGVELLSVTLTDDDGGSDSAGGNVIVTGVAGRTEGSGWWKHQIRQRRAAD